MSRRVRDTLPNVQELSGAPQGCPGVVGTPFRMSGSGRETLPDSRKSLPTTPGHLREDPDRSRTAERAFRPLPDIRAGLPDIQEGPSEHSRTSERASWTSERDSPPLPAIRVGLPTPPGHLGGPPEHSRTSGRVSRPLPDNRGAPRTSRNATRQLPDIRKGLPPLRDIWESVQTIPGPPGWPPELYGGPPKLSRGPPDHSQTSGMASQLLLDIREDLPTTPGPPRVLPDIWQCLPTTLRYPVGPPDHSWMTGRASSRPGGPPTTFGHLEGPPTQ